MNNRREIQSLALLRLEEARMLFQNQLYDGAIYLAGYSIEFALKAVVCKTLDIDEFFQNGVFPQTKTFKTHNLNDLLVFSGLYTKFEQEKLQNSSFFNQWSHLQSVWSEQLRYQPSGSTSRKDAEKLLEAIEHPNRGILPWIQKHW
jgi:HEPN domain-containing protein